MRRGHRERTISGDEVDLVGRWRKWLSSFKRAGKAKAIKRGLNRRARREVKESMKSIYPGWNGNDND